MKRELFVLGLILFVSSFVVAVECGDFICDIGEELSCSSDCGGEGDLGFNGDTTPDEPVVPENNYEEEPVVEDLLSDEGIISDELVAPPVEETFSDEPNNVINKSNESFTSTLLFKLIVLGGVAFLAIGIALIIYFVGKRSSVPVTPTA